MNVGAKYVNRKSGAVVEVTEVDDKCKTLMYKGSDGKERLTSISTFRKSYKEQVSENADVQPEKKSIETSKEPESQPKTEKKSDTKSAEKSPKKERKPRTRKPKNDENVAKLITNVCDIVKGLGGESRVPRSEDMKFRALCKDGRQFCKLMWSGKSIKLFTRNNYKEYAPQVINYNLPNVYEFTTCEESDIKKIKDILTRAYNDTTIKSKNTKDKEAE